MQTNSQVSNNTQTLSLGAHKVLRNTFAMLGLTMVPTVIGAIISQGMNFTWAAQHPIMASLGMLAVMFGLFLESGQPQQQLGCDIVACIDILHGLDVRAYPAGCHAFTQRGPTSRSGCWRNRADFCHIGRYCHDQQKRLQLHG